MKKIAVIGYGYVGKAVADFFKDHFEVIARDLGREYVFGNVAMYERFVGDDDWREVNTAELAVVCVPTPMAPGGSVDLGAIEGVIGKLKTPLIVVKSTVPPGTTEKLARTTGKRIVFSPEFIGEGNYIVQWWKDKGYPHPTDMKYHDFQIFGGEKADAIAALQFFKKVLGPEAKYMITDATTAELCKYMENAWAATKVTFSNEFYEIARAFGVAYDELRELWLLDGRVERSHTAVFLDKRGFRGKCLPKDVNGIVRAAEEAGYTPHFLKQVLETNKQFTAE